MTKAQVEKWIEKHDASFSLECRECCGCGSGDGIDSYDDATALGWTEIEPAPADCPTSYFYGLCPEHTAEQKAEEEP